MLVGVGPSPRGMQAHPHLRSDQGCILMLRELRGPCDHDQLRGEKRQGRLLPALVCDITSKSWLACLLIVKLVIIKEAQAHPEPYIPPAHTAPHMPSHPSHRVRPLPSCVLRSLPDRHSVPPFRHESHSDQQAQRRGRRRSRARHMASYGDAPLQAPPSQPRPCQPSSEPDVVGRAGGDPQPHCPAGLDVDSSSGVCKGLNKQGCGSP